MASSATKTFWPTAHDFAEAVQCPSISFAAASLQRMLPAVDRLGMPLVTSGQFAYVFKLNSEVGGDSLAVRCFRGFLGDREERYSAIDAHLAAHAIPALPHFKYLPRGILVAGRRFPVLVMEWVEGPTLDVYVGEVLAKPDVLRHMADEWVRLVASLRAAGVAHGDLQHGNIIVERGRLRLVDLDGMFVPALAGLRSSEVGHQHYQHPRRAADFFSADVDNFSALVIYLSLVSLAERPALWAEHHDENLLFTRADFERPASSALFAKIKQIGAEHAALAEILETAAAAEDPSLAPPLDEVVGVKSGLPGWMTAPPDTEVVARTREVRRAEALGQEPEIVWRGGVARRNYNSTTPPSNTVQTIFSARQSAAAKPAARQALKPLDPDDLRGNTLYFFTKGLGYSFAWIWMLPIHNVVLTNIWATVLGVTGFASVLASLMLLLGVFFLYGLGRALYLAETGVPQVGGGATGAVHHPVGATYTPRVISSVTAQSSSVVPAFSRAVSNAVCHVVGNQSLMIFHTPDCVWVDKIPARRRQEFASSDAARNAGFRPCRVCTP
jgi:hypothetical protein